MKNFVLTTLAVVIVTIFAAASFAEAQPPSGVNWYSTQPTNPYSNHILPAANPGYGSGYPGVNRPSNWCGTTGTYGPYGTTSGYRGGYSATSGSGIGSVLGSWFGLRPVNQTRCPNGRCTSYPATIPYNQTAPYRPATYPVSNYPGSFNGGFGGNGAYYGEY